MANNLAVMDLKSTLDFCNQIAKSDMIPTTFRGKPENILLAVQWGREVGLSPIQALQNIAVINGRPSIWGDSALAIVTTHPDCEDIIETIDGEGDKMIATCTVLRKGRQPCVRKFSAADAKAAGLWNKAGPWQQYKSRMMQQRARGFALRDSFPDALRGMITTEESRDYPDVKPEQIKEYEEARTVKVIEHVKSMLSAATKKQHVLEIGSSKSLRTILEAASTEAYETVEIKRLMKQTYEDLPE